MPLNEYLDWKVALLILPLHFSRLNYHWFKTMDLTICTIATKTLNWKWCYEKHFFFQVQNYYLFEIMVLTICSIAPHIECPSRFIRLTTPNTMVIPPLKVMMEGQLLDFICWVCYMIIEDQFKANLVTFFEHHII